MRVLLAGVFVFTVLLMTVGVVSSRHPDGGGPWWMAILVVAVMLGAVVAALFLFNPSGYRPVLPGRSREEHIAVLERKGLLISESFRARRTFQMEEVEDEGSHYFIELEDGGVLYLTGQYLHEYEEITDDPELNRSRLFPCSQFTVRRHRKAGYVVEIVIGGEVLEPECLAPAMDRSDVKRGWRPEDGQVFRNRSYEELKRERLKGRDGREDGVKRRTG